MNSVYKYLGTFMLSCGLTVFSGCEADFLDKEPVSIITDDIILQEKSAFEAHLAFLYAEMPFEHFRNYNNNLLTLYTDESVSSSDGTTGANTHWWSDGYELIRALNNMIEKFPSSSIYTDEDEKAAVLGELIFLRAYSYFSLARRYGGVPIVTTAEPLAKSGDITALYIPRNTESDVFKFVESEMDEAINMMSETANPYRLNQWSALALKSRAMLHAASVSTYGEVQLDGLTGIPASEAEYYWQSTRDAAKKVIASGNYELYDEVNDRAENFHFLFFDESETNNERIFVKAYNWPDLVHDFDLHFAPFSHRSGSGYGGKYCPVLEMVESYEYVDDPDGTLKITDEQGEPIAYANPADLFANKDPRFFQTVLYPGAPWFGTTLEIYGSVIEGDVEGEGFGVDGIAQPEATSTGFYMSKWGDRDQTRPVNIGSSDVDRISMRYAEVLLNAAESELELGNEAEARTYVNAIRTRAGLPVHNSPISMDDYRHERKIELAFEDNRYWDMRRWRIFHTLVSNKEFYALWPILDKDKDVYIFRKQLLSGAYTKTFNATMYYNRIHDHILQANALLVQNPGY